MKNKKKSENEWLEKANCTWFKKKVTFGRNFRGWNWKTEIENEKKDIWRYMIITLDIQRNHQQKELENIKKMIYQDLHENLDDRAA